MINFILVKSHLKNKTMAEKKDANYLQNVKMKNEQG